MKKYKLLILLASVLAFTFCFTTASFATTPEEQVVQEYFQANKDIKTSTNPVTHSVFSAGNNVENNSQVDGILFSAGNNLNSNGKTEYSFIAGNNININGEIEKDLFVAGNNINLNAVVNRDTYAAASTININGNLNRNVFIGGGEVRIADNVTIGGDLYLDTEKIILGDNVIITGLLSYNKDAKIKNLNAANYGQVSTYTNPEIETHKPSPLTKIFTTVFKYFSALLIFCLIALVFPKSANRFAEITSSPASVAKQLGVGACALIITPIAFFLLLFTIIGVPLAILVLVYYCIALYLSVGLAGIYLGHIVITKVFNSKPNAYGAIILGLLLINLISLIPIVGGFIYFLAICLGLGILIDFIFARKAKKS